MTSPTGRITRTEPNIQNIPIRTVEGAKIKAALVRSMAHKCPNGASDTTDNGQQRPDPT